MRFETTVMSLRTKSALLEYATTATFYAFIGVWLASKPANVSFWFWFFTVTSIGFAIWDARLGNASQKARIEDQMDAMRYRGQYPPLGKGTDDDVKRLEASGQKVFAVRLYLELNGGSLRDAKRAVDAL